MQNTITKGFGFQAVEAAETEKKKYGGLLFGLLLYIIFEYIRFGAWIKFLEPLHLQRVIAIITLIAFAFSYKDRIIHPKVLIVMLVIVVFSTFANYGDLSRARALHFFVFLAKITAVYYLVSNILIEREHLRKFLSVFLAVNLILVFVGFLAGGYKGALKGGVFAGGFVSDSNDYALAVNVVLPFFWYFLLFERKQLRKAMYAVAFLMSVMAVIYSFSRGGLVGLFAVTVYIISKTKNKLMNFFILALLLGVAIALTPPEYWEKMRTITTEYKETSKGSSSHLRLNLWKIGLNMIVKNPIFGVGPENYPFKTFEYGTDIVPDENERGFISGRLAHNTFISVASELGLSGLLCFLALIVATYKNATFSEKKLYSVQSEEDKWFQALSYSIKAGVVGYCVTAFFVTSYLYPHIYILGAISVALKRCFTINPLPGNPGKSNLNTKLRLRKFGN